MKSKGYDILFIVPLIAVLFYSGCAQKQWRDPLGENEVKSGRKILAAMQQRQNDCSKSVDAELNVTWKSRISDGGFNGYIQTLLPANIKIIAINPLGQPIFAFTTNGRQFQTINVAEKVYKHGSVSNFVKKHSIPNSILHDEWAMWLAGQIYVDETNNQELRQDASLRGFWLSQEKETSGFFANEYLLIDPNSQQLLERVATDKDGNEVARMLYKTWAEINSCPIPSSVEIQSPSYGTNIQLEMKNIKTDKVFKASDLILQAPRGFLQQYYP